MTRNLLILAALAGVLTLAACGGGGDDSTPHKARQDEAFDGALKFAKCMREHGVDMPDPKRTGDGGIVQRIGGPGRGTDRGPNDPKIKAADKACVKYRELGGGDAPDPKLVAKQRDAFVGYARCMRSKGINMPDPKVSGNGIQLSVGKGIRPESTVFKAADKACHPLLGEPEGARGGTKAVPLGSGPTP